MLGLWLAGAREQRGRWVVVDEVAAPGDVHDCSGWAMGVLEELDVAALHGPEVCAWHDRDASAPRCHDLVDRSVDEF
jgi:hypothetical protein